MACETQASAVASASANRDSAISAVNAYLAGAAAARGQIVALRNRVGQLSQQLQNLPLDDPRRIALSRSLREAAAQSAALTESLNRINVNVALARTEVSNATAAFNSANQALAKCRSIEEEIKRTRPDLDDEDVDEEVEEEIERGGGDGGEDETEDPTEDQDPTKDDADPDDIEDEDEDEDEDTDVDDDIDDEKTDPDADEDAGTDEGEGDDTPDVDTGDDDPDDDEDDDDDPDDPDDDEDDDEDDDTVNPNPLPRPRTLVTLILYQWSFTTRVFLPNLGLFEPTGIHDNGSTFWVCDRRWNILVAFDSITYGRRL